MKMRFVCVRSVFSGDVELAGDLRPGQLAVEQPQHLELAPAQRFDQGRQWSGGRDRSCTLEESTYPRPRRDVGLRPGDRPAVAACAGGPASARPRPGTAGRGCPAPRASPRARRSAARADGRSPRAWWTRACSTRISITLPSRPASAAAVCNRSSRPSKAVAGGAPATGSPRSRARCWARRSRTRVRCSYSRMKSGASPTPSPRSWAHPAADVRSPAAICTRAFIAAMGRTSG